MHCRQSKLCYIGFSQGTAQAFAAFSTNPDLLAKVRLFVALSPAVRANHLSKSLLLSLVQANLRCVGGVGRGFFCFRGAGSCSTPGLVCVIWYASLCWVAILSWGGGASIWCCGARLFVARRGGTRLLEPRGESVRLRSLFSSNASTKKLLWRNLTPREITYLCRGNQKRVARFIYLLFGRRRMLPVALTWQRMMSREFFVATIDAAISYLFSWKASQVCCPLSAAAFAVAVAVADAAAAAAVVCGAVAALTATVPSLVVTILAHQ